VLTIGRNLIGRSPQFTLTRTEQNHELFAIAPHPASDEVMPVINMGEGPDGPVPTSPLAYSCLPVAWPTASRTGLQPACGRGLCRRTSVPLARVERGWFYSFSFAV